MSQPPLPSQDVQDSYVEGARLQALRYQHKGVPSDLAPGEGKLVPHLCIHHMLDSGGDDIWYDYTYTVVFRNQWAVKLDETGIADDPPYRV